MTALSDTFPRDRMQGGDVFHRVFAVVGLIDLSGVGYRPFVLLFGAGDGSEGSLPYQVFTSVIYLIATGFVLIRPNVFFSLVSKNIFLLCLLFLAALSIIWSPAPDLTARRSIALIGTFFFAAYLAMCLDEDESMKVILWAMGLIAVFSLLVIIFIPQFGIHQGLLHTGRWRGLYSHKNDLGREMALAAILFYFFRPLEWNRLVCRGIVAICLVLVVFSASAQGLVLIAVVIPAGIFLGRLSGLKNPLLVGSLVLLIVGMVMWVFLAEAMPVLLEALGKDPTLSGRTNLWKSVVAYTVRNNLMFGSGFTGELQLASLRTWSSHAHNGYVQLFSELGLVGVVLFGLISLVHWKNALLRAANYRTVYSRFLIIFSIYFYMLSIVASPILAQSSVIWLLFVFVAIKAGDRSIRLRAYHSRSGHTRS